MSPQAPLRRTAGLVVREVGDETVVYDERTGEAHALEAVAARVWAACDGTADLTGRVGAPREAVDVALAQLDAAGLLERPAGAGLSRRGLLTAGAAVLGGAAVTTIVAPSAAMASSLPAACVAPGTTWTLTDSIRSSCASSAHPNPTSANPGGLGSTFGFYSVPSGHALSPQGVSKLSWGATQFCGIYGYELSGCGCSSSPLLTYNGSGHDITVPSGNGCTSGTWKAGTVGAATGCSPLVIVWKPPTSCTAATPFTVTGTVTDLYGNDTYGAVGTLYSGALPGTQSATLTQLASSTRPQVTSGHPWSFSATPTLTGAQGIYLVLKPYSSTHAFVPLSISLSIKA